MTEIFDWYESLFHRIKKKLFFLACSFGRARLTLPQTYSDLISKTQTSLGDLGLGCIALERHQFSHSVFQGASFDLKCDKGEATQTSILSALDSIDGVRKAWPVSNVESTRAVSNTQSGVFRAGDLARRVPPTERDTSYSLLQARAETNGTVDTLSSHVMTGVDKLHAEGITGSGLRIAVIDDGFDLDTPGLSQTTIRFAHDLIDGDNDVRDNCSYHGTHVLGIVGAKGAAEVYGVTGVAPDATFDLYRIAACGPRGASTDNLMKATLEAADRGVDVLSCSYGGGLAFPEGEYLHPSLFALTPLRQLIKYSRSLVSCSDACLRERNLRIPPEWERRPWDLFCYQPCRWRIGQLRGVCRHPPYAILFLVGKSDP